MTAYGATTTFNSVVITMTRLTPVRTQKTRKTVLGKTLTQTKIIGLTSQQWELRVDAYIVGTTAANLSTNRAAVEGLDTVTPYTFVDGIHNGTYILQPGSLIFKDNSDDVAQSYKYSMTLVEE